MIFIKVMSGIFKIEALAISLVAILGLSLLANLVIDYVYTHQGIFTGNLSVLFNFIPTLSILSVVAAAMFLIMRSVTFELPFTRRPKTFTLIEGKWKAKQC